MLRFILSRIRFYRYSIVKSATIDFFQKYARAFVAIQFMMLAVILIGGHIFSQTLTGIVMQLLGGVAGIWGIISMKTHNLAISPIPKQNAEFVVSGLYKWIRNPMYLGLLLVTVPLVIEAFSWWIILCELVLIADLGVKIYIEEKLLEKKFETYKAYKSRTWRLIPFII